jgi:hypothetical protein
VDTHLVIKGACRLVLCEVHNCHCPALELLQKPVPVLDLTDFPSTAWQASCFLNSNIRAVMPSPAASPSTHMLLLPWAQQGDFPFQLSLLALELLDGEFGEFR